MIVWVPKCVRCAFSADTIMKLERQPRLVLFRHRNFGDIVFLFDLRWGWGLRLLGRRWTRCKCDHTNFVVIDFDVFPPKLIVSFYRTHKDEEYSMLTRETKKENGRNIMETSHFFVQPFENKKEIGVWATQSFCYHSTGAVSTMLSELSGFFCKTHFLFFAGEGTYWIVPRDYSLWHSLAFDPKHHSLERSLCTDQYRRFFGVWVGMWVEWRGSGRE